MHADFVGYATVTQYVIYLFFIYKTWIGSVLRCAQCEINILIKILLCFHACILYRLRFEHILTMTQNILHRKFNINKSRYYYQCVFFFQIFFFCSIKD